MTTVARRRDPPPLFCKCVKRKGFKSFVLKVCDSKGVADAFLGKCVKLKRLGAMWGLLGICDRSFGSLRSLPSCLRARTTISGFRSPVDSTGVQRPDLIGWSLSEEEGLEVRCRESDGKVPREETHVSPWFVSKGPTGIAFSF